MLDWKPAVGQVGLIQLISADGERFTGVVRSAGGSVVVMDVGGSSLPSPGEATVSFFCPDALYRIEVTLSPRDGREFSVELAVHGIERVQRRVFTRTKLSVPVVLSNLDGADIASGEYASVLGETTDLGQGGCRVVVNRRFPAGSDPTVTLNPSAPESILALAAVLEERARPDGRFEYRLVFIDQNDHHRELIAEIIANAA